MAALQYNPYSSPAGGPPPSPYGNPFAAQFVPALASVGARFFARILDGMLPFGLGFFVFFAAGGPPGSDARDVDPYAEEQYGFEEAEEPPLQDDFGYEGDAEFEDDVVEYEDEDELEPPPPRFPKSILFMALLLFGFQILQYYLISTSGQTIGKKMLRIRIVTEDGRPVGFWDGVAKRELLMGLLTSIPFIGGFIGLYDALTIFSADRRMLHDKLAGTVVVEADSVPADGVQPGFGAHAGHAPSAHAPPAGRFGPPPAGIGYPGAAEPSAASDLLTEVRSAPPSVELARRVDRRLQELARTGVAGEILELYRAVASRGGMTLSDRSLLVAEQAATEVGESEFAVSIVRELMAAHPSSDLIPRAMWDVATIQLRAGREDLARATLQGLIDRFPGDPFAQQARARLGQ